MEAEAREFRSELWQAAALSEADETHKPFTARILFGARVSLLAAIMLMAGGLPLSMDQESRFQGFQENSLVLLTSTESDILGALRENLSNRNAGRVLISVELPERKQDEKDGKNAASAEEAGPERMEVLPAETKNEERPAANEALNAKAPDAAEEPTVEEVISLIQVGQRALRVMEPAVKVLPVQR
jgi:hypothetical protein